jgi:hypothetical protein
MDPVTQQKIEELSQRVEQLHREGRYPAANPLAAEAAQLLKQTVGEADLRFIRTTTCLANLFRVSEAYDKAKALEMWALLGL